MPRTKRPAKSTRHKLLKAAAWGLPILALAGMGAAWLAYRSLDRMPGELLRHAEQRLYGHTKLETVGLPLIAMLRARVEREVPPGLPALGKGVQVRPLPPVRYKDGNPLESELLDVPSVAPTVQVSTFEELQKAMQAARPGDVVELQPGRYAMRGRLSTANAGRADNPITVRAAMPGTAEILSTTVEGFFVNQPYWIFENLTIRGVCDNDGNCEHAFHVVGAAKGTVIRNNRISDFNAHLKVNGDGGRFPDDGLLQFNTLDNSRPRRTGQPVTPFDLVAASRWVVADNLVANFVKAGSNGISYGVFMKGGGSQGRIERNLVICSLTDISARGDRPGTGARVGISLGGGTTGGPYCRTPQCMTEHYQGIVANNVVAHCNDAGIDVNRSEQSVVAHNTLINTGWIDVRNSPASAVVYGNWLEGRVRTRGGGWVEDAGNETRALAGFTAAPDALALGWTSQPPTIAPARAVTRDFCGRPRGAASPPGAIGTEGVPCAQGARAR
ncbi:hypothetical protein [Pseudorhodoferax sp. Leaf267]|uniref:hypothetical protein n=1 Tax=Pseudorhodoferax sp. Leaf267 TaxID=1736316 RepID=UPI000700A3F7|nr:hypothetical protein [Pseudorhodoferax sp. Leaf267]KQP20523.1 hypothetical protein ASF43_27215 [Pseudorhodoferax sp. Leaf267]